MEVKIVISLRKQKPKQKATASLKAAVGSLSLGQSAGFAACAEWEMDALPEELIGYAITVVVNFGYKYES